MILRAAWVVPVVGPPIRDGYIEIKGDRIAAVGPWKRLEQADPVAATGRQVFNLGDLVLTPGLVNPHTHLELTCYGGQIPPARLWDWFPRLMTLRRDDRQHERERQAAHDGAWQSLRAGVTCVGDISRNNVAWRALKDVPIRKVCFVELLSLADFPPRTPAELREAVQHVEEDDLLTAGITPHAPYTVRTEDIRAAIELAAELKRPWCMHWAETPEELAYIRGTAGALPKFVEVLASARGVHSPARSPKALLEYCGKDLPPGALAHVNYVEEEDIEHLAAAGHVVMYCPRAHRFFGHPPHPFSRLRAAQVAVAVGTDSLASNESLSMLDELCFLRTVLPLPPAELFRLATLDAARALGLQDRIGSLEPGKQADLAAFPYRQEGYDETIDPLAVLITQPAPPRAVWVAGRQVV